jgi:L-fuculose-phosphate aldolase
LSDGESETQRRREPPRRWPTDERALRRKLVEVCHRTYHQGFIAAMDGNVSARLGRDRVLVTPSGFHKGRIREEDLVVTDLAGRKLAGRHRPSSEFLMHELAYAERADVGAVVHAHPPIAVALALAGVSLQSCVLSESCLSLGAIVTAPYATPTTAEVPESLRDLVRRWNAIILMRHGALTLGADLDEAYNRMEIVEHTAKIVHAARAIGPVTPLPEEEVDKLRRLAAPAGVVIPAPDADPDEEALIRRVEDAVRKRLASR